MSNCFTNKIIDLTRENFRMNIFFSKKLSLDTWSYGEWKQYIAWHKNGDAQCCYRVLYIPFIGWLCVAVQERIAKDINGDYWRPTN